MIERAKERLPLIRPLFVPFILYIGLLAMAATFMENSPNSPWRLPVVLAPVIPALFLAVGIVRVIQKLDELNRKIILEACAVSFTATLFLTIVLGLLESGDLFHVEGVWIGMFMVTVWFVAKLVIARKYGV